MVKIDLKNILIIGGLAVGGYFLLQHFAKQDTVKVFPPPTAAVADMPVKGIQNYEKPSAHNIDYIGESGDAVANFAAPNYMRGWY